MFAVAAEVLLIPRITSVVLVAAVARKSPTKLLKILTVVPAETRIPLTVVPALLPLRSYILFLETLFVVPAVTAMPVTAAAPVDESELIVFEKAF